MQSAVSEQKQQADMTAGSTPSRNLYVSGFGAQTSAQEIKDMFAEYCEVIDVIVKGKFAFVNTMSMEGAAAALQKLQGVSLGGSTIRVRWARHSCSTVVLLHLGNRYAKDLHALSSRNLHVTGFTANEETKQQLCDLFSKHCSVTLHTSISRSAQQCFELTLVLQVFDVFVKQKYAFVNTESPEGAAKAMEELQDAPFDGGRLVINYAKDRRTQVAPQQYDIQPGLMVLNQAPPVWQYPQMQMQLQGQAGYQQPVYQLASNSQPQFQPQMYAMPHQAAQEAQIEPTAMAPEAFAAREQYDQNL